MNPRLGALQPYPFARLRQLLADTGAPSARLGPIDLSIGEPRHKTPDMLVRAMCDAMGGLAKYPPTRGDAALRGAIADWIARRHGISRPDPDTQVLPALGSREALFACAQAIVDPAADAIVVCPNPFYQIYEGAALLAGARPWYINADAGAGFGYDWRGVPADTWRKTQLLFVCSPGNPTGHVLDLNDWKTLFALSDQYGFVIASDECYSEIYFDEENKPLGSMQAAQRLGRTDFHNLLCFSSLSKRSNAPGLRSGFIAGDATLIAQCLLYRTYHGSAMSAVVSQASIAAWNDESHVIENRRRYREKFAAVVPLLATALDVQWPRAAFYLWVAVPGSDTDFARRLYRDTAVTVLPGSFLAREAHGENPGAGRIRIALVAHVEECVEAATRIAAFAR